MEEYIMSLITRMTVKEEFRTSQESVSWHAHREAETLTDPDLYPILKNIILSRQSKKDTDIRDAAYFIMGKLFLKVPSDEYCIFYIQQLENETNKYLVSSMLDWLCDIEIPLDADISPIIACTKSDKWLIRYSAIKALGSSNTKESKETLAYFLNQTDDKKYKDEITYANAALGRIGTLEDIPLLEQHVKSRKWDVKDSAIYAIERIQQREGKR